MLWYHTEESPKILILPKPILQIGFEICFPTIIWLEKLSGRGTLLSSSAPECVADSISVELAHTHPGHVCMP